MDQKDIVIIGGGIVGLATAFRLMQRCPDKTITIVEKEKKVAYHQSGHNSGVIHSGIYYKPGSLKAVTCRAGKKEMEEFCEREGIDYKIPGKVIVAYNEDDLVRLHELYQRGKANGVRCELIDRARLLELEPHAAGIAAVHVLETGVVSYGEVCQRLAMRIKDSGHRILTSAKVVGLKEAASEVIVRTNLGELSARHVINCGGLHSDRLASLGGQRMGIKIVPFRGEYFTLTPQAEHLCRGLIYPVPDPEFPFLGVHFTRTISGQVKCGPNAVLALAREGYGKADISIRDVFGTLAYPGFLKLAARYWQKGLGEVWRSISKSAFVKALQRLIPDIRIEQLVPVAAGVRAQAVAPNGAMLDDFYFQEGARIINVVNAPSPAATASLAIGKLIVDKLVQKF